MEHRHPLERELERYRPALEALALDRTGDPETARDIAQDAFELALRHLGQLREPKALPGWLRTIALNCCRQHLRRPREPAVIAQPAESAYRVAVRRQMLREVRGALARLPENNRLALLMHVLHGISYERIAAFLGVPVSTIEGRIHRARRQLRREHEGWLVEGARHGKGTR